VRRVKKQLKKENEDREKGVVRLGGGGGGGGGEDGEENNSESVRKIKGQSLGGIGGNNNMTKKKKSKTNNNNNNNNSSPNNNISNENDLVNIIISLINNLPNSQRLTVSAVGDRLQDLTGHSWNKKFKKNYGTLKSFLEKRKEFHVDSKDHVLISQGGGGGGGDVKSKAKVKKVNTPIKPQKIKQPRSVEPGSEVTPSLSTTRSGGKRGDNNNKSDESGMSAVRIFFVMILVITVLLLTLISLDGGSKHFFEQFKKFVKK